MPRLRLRRPADVRLFPGWAESVLWVSGPLDYDDLDLPADLVADLRQWDLVWSGDAHPDAPRAPRRVQRERGRRHDREGRRLARRVADAFGRDLVVELHLTRRLLGRPRYRGRGPATAPRAAAAVRTEQRERVAEQTRIDQLKAEGAMLEWRAYPPDTP